MVCSPGAQPQRQQRSHKRAAVELFSDKLMHCCNPSLRSHHAWTCITQRLQGACDASLGAGHLELWQIPAAIQASPQQVQVAGHRRTWDFQRRQRLRLQRHAAGAQVRLAVQEHVCCWVIAAALRSLPALVPWHETWQAPHSDENSLLAVQHSRTLVAAKEEHSRFWGSTRLQLRLAVGSYASRLNWAVC